MKLNDTISYFLFMDDFGNDWCRTESCGRMIAIGPCFVDHAPKKEKKKVAEMKEEAKK